MVLPDTSLTKRLVVFMPSWVGDAVMALPTLRALRQLLGDASITCVCRSYVRPVLDSCPWYDGLIVTRRAGRPPRDGLALAGRLRRRRFDTAVLLTNSFRSAWIARVAGIPRRIGYDRDVRAPLLTDRLLPLKRRGAYVPVSAVDYYLSIARYLGATMPDRAVTLFTRAGDDAWAQSMLQDIAPAQPRVLLCPGAATKGDAKLWPTERFAALADQLVADHNATILLSGSPKERALLDEVAAGMKAPVVNLLDQSMNLRRFKAVCWACDLMIANDTGSRHIGVAAGTQVVALFGPTDPEWTRLDMPNETVLLSTAADHAMTGIEVDAVYEAAAAQLAGATSSGAV